MRGSFRLVVIGLLAGASPLAAQEADAVFLRMPVPEEFAAIPLYEEQPVVVMEKEHLLSALDAVAPADLEGVHLIDDEWGAAVELAATGVGVAIMPQSVARALSRKDVVARPAVDQPTTRIALAWHPDAATELTEEFIGIVRGRTANSSRGSEKEATFSVLSIVSGGITEAPAVVTAPSPRSIGYQIPWVATPASISAEAISIPPTPPCRRRRTGTRRRAGTG